MGDGQGKKLSRHVSIFSVDISNVDADEQAAYEKQTPDHWDHPDTTRAFEISITGKGNRWQLISALDKVLDLLHDDEIENQLLNGLDYGDLHLTTHIKKTI